MDSTDKIHLKAVVTTRCIKFEGDPPMEIINAEIDPSNPPPCVLEIIDFDADNQQTVIYSRDKTCR